MTANHLPHRAPPLLPDNQMQKHLVNKTLLNQVKNVIEHGSLKKITQRVSSYLLINHSLYSDIFQLAARANNLSLMQELTAKSFTVQATAYKWLAMSEGRSDNIERLKLCLTVCDHDKERDELVFACFIEAFKTGNVPIMKMLFELKPSEIPNLKNSPTISGYSNTQYPNEAVYCYKHFLMLSSQLNIAMESINPENEIYVVRSLEFVCQAKPSQESLQEFTITTSRRDSVSAFQTLEKWMPELHKRYQAIAQSALFNDSPNLLKYLISKGSSAVGLESLISLVETPDNSQYLASRSMAVVIEAALKQQKSASKTEKTGVKFNAKSRI